MVLFKSAGLLNEENEEIISFGLTRLSDLITSCTFSVVCAWVMGNFWVGVLFETSYMLLRRYAGGYHAKNKRNCFVLTYVSTFLCILFIFIMPFEKVLTSILFVFFDIIIFQSVPVESKNKKLNTVERKVYRKKAISIALILTCLFYAGIIFDFIVYSKTIFISMLLVVMGIILNGRIKK